VTSTSLFRLLVRFGKRSTVARTSVDHGVRTPAQRDNSPLRIRDLGFERGAAEEVVIEFARVMPAHLDERAIPRAQVVRIDAGRDLEGVAKRARKPYEPRSR
jgi:hypothetical protein